MKIVANDPRDEIRLGLLCPGQNWKGICTQKACAASGGNCVLNGKPWAPFCVIPQSHPVRDVQREIAAANEEARRHLQ